MNEFKSVVFSVGQQEYGVDINFVRGIEKVIQIVPVPNSNPCIKGIINLRGDVVPIFSLRKKFGLDDIAATEDTKFIIVKTDKILIGLEVDKVGEIQNVEEKSIFQMPEIVISKDTDYYNKVINNQGKLIIMLDVCKLLTDEEFDNLEKVILDIR